ncbi:hypothetical protein GN956_G851 [Arapaima gigas]
MSERQRGKEKQSCRSPLRLSEKTIRQPSPLTSAPRRPEECPHSMGKTVFGMQPRLGIRPFLLPCAFRVRGPDTSARDRFPAVKSGAQGVGGPFLGNCSWIDRIPPSLTGYRVGCQDMPLG